MCVCTKEEKCLSCTYRCFWCFSWCKYVQDGFFVSFHILFLFLFVRLTANFCGSMAEERKCEGRNNFFALLAYHVAGILFRLSHLNPFTSIAFDGFKKHGNYRTLNWYFSLVPYIGKEEKQTLRLPTFGFHFKLFSEWKRILLHEINAESIIYHIINMLKRYDKFGINFFGRLDGIPFVIHHTSH